MNTSTIISWDEYWNSIKDEYCREETHDIDISNVSCIKPINVQIPSMQDILEFVYSNEGEGNYT